MKFFKQFKPHIHIPMILGGVVLMGGLAFIFGLIVMLLWNWLMPEIFGFSPITYWQGWGLVLLAHILFKSGSHHGHDHDHDHDHHNRWKNRFYERMHKAFSKEGTPSESSGQAETD